MTNSFSPWTLVLFLFFSTLDSLFLWAKGTPSPHIGLEDAKLQLLVLQREASFFKSEVWYVLNVFTNSSKGNQERNKNRTSD